MFNYYKILKLLGPDYYSSKVLLANMIGFVTWPGSQLAT